MGIEGFKTYVMTNSEQLLETINLSNKYLVVEAECLIYQLYGRFIDEIYINKYEIFEKNVNMFLDDLSDCNIIPIIIFKGGKEIQNLIKHIQDVENSISKMKLDIQKKKVTQLPILLEEIVKCAARKKHVKVAQTLFKTEFDAVSISKILDCPILSDVNDYYLHNVSFIPFSKEFKKIKVNNNFVINCKLYKVKNILKYFPDQRTMAIAKIVLNNYWRKTKVLTNFYSTLKLDSYISNRSVKRIQAVLTWFQTHTLHTAIANILQTVDIVNHNYIIKIFENSVYEHTNLSFKLIEAVEIPKETIDKIKVDLKTHQIQYKYDDFRNHNYLEQNFNNSIEIKNEKITLEPVFNQIALSYFINEFFKGKYPSYFIDIYFRKVYTAPVQIENLSYDPCNNISLPIIGIIFKILTGSSDSGVLKYIRREKNGTGIEIYNLVVKEIDYSFEIPSLKMIIDIPLIQRREILMKTLKLSQKHLKDFLPEWILYMGTTVYWFKNSEKIFTENCFLYSLMLTMIYSVAEKTNNNTFENFNNLFIMKNLQKITEKDCLKFIQTFNSAFKTKVCFDINKIHGFLLFENCFKHVIHLNALLNYPYPDVNNISQLLNGKIIDQLYHSFKNKRYPLQDLKIILEESPIFLSLFESIMSKFQSMI